MKFKWLLLISFTFFIYNCGSNNSDLTPEASKSTIKGAPNWYINTKCKEGYKCSVASATSQDMQIAVNKATSDASTILAGMVETEMNGLVKRVREEVGQDDDSDLLDTFSQVQEQIIATTLQDYSVPKKEIVREKNSKGNNIFRAYVYVEWDEGAAQERMLQKIKDDKALFDLIRSTELYEEMEEKVEKYRKRYNK